MNNLSGRTIINPVSGEKVTFIQTSSETNGLKSVIEIEIQPNGDGPPPHFHKAYTESFKVLDGELSLKTGKEKKKLNKGGEFIVEKMQVHTFRNESTNPTRLEVTLTPGHEGFEKAIAILFGLSEDGLTSKKGIPKKLINLTIINQLSDSHFTGLLSFVSAILSRLTNQKKLSLTQNKLIEKYC